MFTATVVSIVVADAEPGEERELPATRVAASAARSPPAARRVPRSALGVALAQLENLSLSGSTGIGMCFMVCVCGAAWSVQHTHT